MNKTNSILMLIASVVAAFSLTSCEFDSVAREMNGTWTGKSVKTNEDQSKEHQTIYFKFNYDEKAGKGTFVEVRDVQIEDYETLLEHNINVSYKSYIEGAWVVTEEGELAMKPDLNTLKVIVKPNDKDIQKDIFSNLHQDYEIVYDPDVPFSDLQVQSDAMSFVSNQNEKTTLHKTDLDIMSVFNQGSKQAKSKKTTPADQGEEEASEDALTDETSDDEGLDETNSTDEEEGNDDDI